MTILSQTPNLPGLDCGACGYRSCDLLAEQLATQPELLERCINLSKDQVVPRVEAPCQACGPRPAAATVEWRDTHDREFDFFLEPFPEDPGPREVIIPHNPMLTREMEIAPGDLIIGRPLGMSCGCPITHCGVVSDVDARTGVMTWCVTGILGPRERSYKDIGYYIAEGYEGLIRQSRVDPKIGVRYYFLPRRCMLQWRHSGLVNYINKSADGIQVRIEGLWIG